MKKFITFLFVAACFNMAHSENKINITIEGRSLTATLADNVATKALVDKLAVQPITITMRDYGGFEKVGALPWDLPTSDSQITTKPGDIMLYTGNNIVIFYGENSWAYTPLGTLETTDSNEIRNFVGDGNKQLTISLDNASIAPGIITDTDEIGSAFTLDGRVVSNQPLPPGLYVVNGKKVIVKAGSTN